MFAEEPDPIKKAENALKKAVEKAGKKLEIVNVRLMKGIAPRKWQVAIDARIY
jgi:tRNA G37 N-methylase Trm5